MQSEDDDGAAAPERCHICDRTLERAWQTVAIDDDGTEYKGWVVTEPYAVAVTSVGEINVCGNCYPRRAAARLNADDMAEVHYEWGLTTKVEASSRPLDPESERQVLQAVKQCFLDALRLRRKADYLAALATVTDPPEEADRLNREALALDPKCLAAYLNLHKLEPDDDGNLRPRKNPS